jgi:hypothetical protein
MSKQGVLSHYHSSHLMAIDLCWTDEALLAFASSVPALRTRARLCNDILTVDALNHILAVSATFCL